MLTPAQIEGLREAAGRLTDPITEYIIRDVARRVSKAGKMTSTAAYQLWRAREMGAAMEELEEYVGNQGIKNMFLEEGKEAAMDTLLLGLELEEDLSIDISCNFVHAPEFGNVLQYYGQLELNSILEENPQAFTELNIYQMLNALNRELPVGQFLYIQEEGEEQVRHLIGIRYTMLTDLEDEAELAKCFSIVEMLMNIYEVLCSTLLLLMEGESLSEAMDIMAGLMEE